MAARDEFNGGVRADKARSAREQYVHRNSARKPASSDAGGIAGKIAVHELSASD